MKYLLTLALFLSLVVCAEARHSSMSHVSYYTPTVPVYTVVHSESGHGLMSHPTGRTDIFGNPKMTRIHSED